MAEQLINEFTVNRPIDEAWAIITDVERIAPCLPGAELQEIEGETYRGVVKVKLGAISSQFKGEANFLDRDDAAHRAVIKGVGRDTGGRGNASAEITAQAESLSPTSTKVVVTTDLHITGKVAQFGRGIMGDVSSKLMAQFANNLNEMLDEQGLDTPPRPEPSADESAATTTKATQRPSETDRRPTAGSDTSTGRRTDLAGPQDPRPGHRADRPDGGRWGFDPEAGDPCGDRTAARAVRAPPPSGLMNDHDRVTELLGRAPKVRSTWSCEMRRATRWSSATPRSSTTAPRCPPGTTSSAPNSSVR